MDVYHVKNAQARPGCWLQQIKEAFSGNDSSNADGLDLRWHLDYPASESPVKMTAAGIVVQGWVLLGSQQAEWQGKPFIVAAWEASYELYHPLEVERADVIERVLKVSAEGHPQRYCGFRFTVPPGRSEFTLLLECEGQRRPLKTVEIIGSDVSLPEAMAPLKVLEGKAGWLFLDNDTNASVDQYRGRLLLTAKGIKSWRRYLSAFHVLAETQGAAAAVLVAPSKESVMGPRYHPFKEGEGGPIQQLMEQSEAKMLIHPVDKLKSLGDAAFIQTDTHWSQQGAMVASCALAVALGLDETSVEDVFADDDYVERSLAGDLGSKLNPERTCQIHLLRTFNYRHHCCFDNGLPNFGRLIVLANASALMQGTLLIFGSSSSYSMFNYLARLFEHVIFVHSAGSLDPELINAIRPDFLVTQTNARFVVQVPTAKSSLHTLVKQKRARLTGEEAALVTQRRICSEAHASLISALGLAPWVFAEESNQGVANAPDC